MLRETILVLFYLFLLEAKKSHFTIPTPPETIDQLPQPAIVCLTKKPHHLNLWVSHYLDHLKVAKIYLYLDYYPGIGDDLNDSLEAIYSTYGSRFEVTYVTKEWLEESPVYTPGNRDRSSENRVRQITIMEDALGRGQEDQLDWIFHIDIDELIHIQTGETLPEFLHRFNQEIDPNGLIHTVFFFNWELIPKHSGYKNCFKEGKVFRSKGRGFIAYGNGKGGARLNGLTRSFGVHRFASSVPDALPSYSLSEEQFIVLHYVCCNTEEFIAKYRNLGAFTNKGWEWANFHREARDKMYECRPDPNVPLEKDAPITECEQNVVDEMFTKRAEILPHHRPYIKIIKKP